MGIFWEERILLENTKLSPNSTPLKTKELSPANAQHQIHLKTERNATEKAFLSQDSHTARELVRKQTISDSY